MDDSKKFIFPSFGGVVFTEEDVKILLELETPVNDYDLIDAD